MSVSLDDAVAVVDNEWEQDHVIKSPALGMVIQADGGTPLTGAVLKLSFTKPVSGTVVERTATIDGTNPNLANYTVVAGDLDEIGEYLFVLEANFGSQATPLYGKTVQVDVVDRFYTSSGA